MKIIKLLTLIIGVSTLNISCKSFSIKTNDFKTLITADSLSYIYLLNKNQFGFLSYSGQSPLSYKNRVRTNYNHTTFEINEQGSGEFSYKKDKLILNFTKPKTSIDSISIKETKSIKENDSIEVNILFKSYTKNYPNNGSGMGSTIMSSDSLINYNTMFDDFALIKIAKKDIPIKLIINENYEFEINKKINQEVFLFINEFKKNATNEIEDKTFDTKTLILLKKINN